MNAMTRYFTRPLLFAALAVATVITFGEPVEASQGDALAPLPEVVGAVAAAETAAADAAKVERHASHASRLRWVITMPGARRSSCCRRPV